MGFRLVIIVPAALLGPVLGPDPLAQALAQTPWPKPWPRLLGPADLAHPFHALARSGHIGINWDATRVFTAPKHSDGSDAHYFALFCRITGLRVSGSQELRDLRI